jgi:hypothetical protein
MSCCILLMFLLWPLSSTLGGREGDHIKSKINATQRCRATASVSPAAHKMFRGATSGLDTYHRNDQPITMLFGGEIDGMARNVCFVVSFLLNLQNSRPRE